MQTHGRLSMKVRLAREAGRTAGERGTVRGCAECGSSSSLASEQNGQGEEMGRSANVERGRDAPYEEVREDRRRRIRCRVRSIVLNFVRRAKS